MLGARDPILFCFILFFPSGIENLGGVVLYFMRRNNDTEENIHRSDG